MIEYDVGNRRLVHVFIYFFIHCKLIRNGLNSFVQNKACLVLCSLIFYPFPKNSIISNCIKTNKEINSFLLSPTQYSAIKYLPKRMERDGKSIFENFQLLLLFHPIQHSCLFTHQCFFFHSLLRPHHTPVRL